MILQKNKNKNKNKNNSNRGFVILFAVTISSILLAITLGVSNIALKEIKFSTSARDTNDAFFAADTGSESVLFKDKTPAYYPAPLAGTTQSWPEETINGLGGGGFSCVNIIVTKDNNRAPQPMLTTIVSKGYNTGSGTPCTSSNPNRIERILQVTY